MTEYLLEGSTYTRSGPQEGDTKITVTAGEFTIQHYSNGAWSDVTLGAASEPTYQSEFEVVDLIANLPTVGVADTLYFVEEDNVCRVWDAVGEAYVQVEGGANA